MSKKLQLAIVLAILAIGAAAVASSLSSHGFVPGGGHFRGHGATSDW